MTTTALVTGSSDGIGLETARGLLSKGWRVLVHGRNEARAIQAVAGLAGAGGDAVPVWGDLAVMAQVRALAAQASALAPGLDLLVLNAGVYEQKRSLTVDGFERTLGINHFAQLLLTLRLAGNLAAAKVPRVLWVSSGVHLGAHLDPADLDLARGWSGYGSYGASKLANACIAAEQARRVEWREALCFSLHPGVVATKLLHRNFGPGGVSLADGARTSLYCATQAGLEGLSGSYFSASTVARPHAKVLDPVFGKDLWEASLQRLSAWL